MRISAAYIPATAGKSNVTPVTDKAVRQQTVTARDSYTKKQTQIIYAEYVEFYSPSVDLFNKERQTLDITIEPATGDLQKSTGDSRGLPTAALGKYQLKAHEAPPPGSYIDTFA